MRRMHIYMKYMKAARNKRIYTERTIIFLASIRAVIGQYWGRYSITIRSKDGNSRYKAVQEETHKNFQLKQEIKEIKKKMFSEKQRQAIVNKLAKKEKNFLERLLKVIDVYSSKAKSEKLKAQLVELKEITQERIDAIK